MAAVRADNPGNVDLRAGARQGIAMAVTRSLNAKNLGALGAKRLAALLIEVSKGNAVAQRRLRLELAGAAGGDDAAREIHKRISGIARAKTFTTGAGRRRWSPIWRRSTARS